MKRIIITLRVLVYVIYVMGLYFFIVKGNYKVSSIILMIAVAVLNFDYDLFKNHLINKFTDKNKNKEMIKMLNDYQEENKLPKCTCHDVNQCDTWCVGKENYTKASRHGIE